MICCYDLFMAWFCCYDFDTVSVMFFDVGQTCDLKPTHRNHIQKIFKTRIKTIAKSYQNQNKIKSKPQKTAKNRPKTCPWAVSVSLFEANSLEPHQNGIKIISKTYQNRIKIIPKP